MGTRYLFKSVFKSETNDTETVTLKEFNADCMDEILEEFREFLLGCGFSPKTIEKYEIKGDE